MWDCELAFVPSTASCDALTAIRIGFAPYSVGLYANNRFGTEWLLLFGAALCGLSAGVFWMSKATIAIAYPEPENRGKILGYWLTWTVLGNILGGVINLGLNADRTGAGSVGYEVYFVFIAIQSAAPLVAWLLTPPRKAERTGGKEVRLEIHESVTFELKEMAREFLTKRFLLLILFIGTGVYFEAVYFTYIACKHSPYMQVFLLTLGSVVQRPSTGTWIFPFRNRYNHFH